MPKIRTDETPKNLRPYLFHGLDLSGSPNASGECPFCGREKFSVSVETGLWRCFSCEERGNLTTFLRKIHELDGTTDGMAEFMELRDDRGVSLDALRSFGVMVHPVTGEYTLPGFSTDKKLMTLYQWSLNGDKKILMATATVPHQLFMPDDFDPKKRVVYVCEGPWDAMALWDALRSTKAVEGHVHTQLARTGSVEASLYAEASVVGIPGCGSVGEPFVRWCSLFAGKRVVLCFDSDHPRVNGDKRIEPAGLEASKRACEILARVNDLPESVSYLCWGPDGYDKDRKSGYDVRDLLTEGDQQGGLAELMDKVSDIPEDWVKGRSATSKRGGKVGIECLPCESWRDLEPHWRRAMKWVPGLRKGMVVSLAAIVSTRAIGDQLWIKMVGPPSCLHGETLIHDPVNNTTKTVRERWKEGKSFFVYSQGADGVVTISVARPPERFPEEEMALVTFRSGKRFKVTYGHRIWNGIDYAALHTIVDELRECSSYPVPTTSESGLLAQTQDALRSSRKAVDSRCGCPYHFCSCGGQLLPEGGSARDDVPSLTDVQERSHCSCSKGDSVCECRHSSQTHTVPLSSYRGKPQIEKPDGEEEHPSGVDSPESFYKDDRRTESSPSPQQSDTSLLSACPVLQSNSMVEETHSLEGFYQHDPEMPEESLLYSSGSFPENIGEDTPRSSSGATPVLQLGESRLQQDEDTSVTPPSQRTYFRKPQPGTSLIGIVEPLLDDVLQTMEQPYDEPPKKVRDTTILPEADAIVKVEPIGKYEYYDFHVVGTENYWADGFFHHNCGKTTLVEAMAVAKQYVYATDTMTGLVSGYQVDREGSENMSMVLKLKDKTLVIKDADTILSDPSLQKILSQFRAFYDRALRTQYGNRMSAAHEGINTTVILCGTNSLRKLDSSELGERFLDCVIMDRIEEDLENEVLKRKFHQSWNDLSQESNGQPESQVNVDMLAAMQRTGGYVTYLRQNARELLAGVTCPDEVIEKVQDYGKFVAYMRARPSARQDETSEREFAARLVSQITRLTGCLSVVLNKRVVDAEVMDLVRSVVMDTARGRTMEICAALHDKGDEGLSMGALEAEVHAQEEGRITKLVKFLRHIGAVESYVIKSETGFRTTKKFRLSGQLRGLYGRVVSE